VTWGLALGAVQIGTIAGPAAGSPVESGGDAIFLAVVVPTFCTTLLMVVLGS
jgi:hypothetical protein